MYVEKEKRNLINIIKYLNSKADEYNVIKDLKTEDLMKDLNLRLSEVSQVIKILRNADYLKIRWQPSTKTNTYYIKNKL